MALIIHQFNDSNPFALAKLNESLAAIVGTINALAGDSLLELSPAPGNDGGVTVPVAGGAFLGQISAPSILIGTTEAGFFLALNAGDFAGVSLLAQTISATPTQAQVQAISNKVDALIGVLKNP